MKIALLGYGKMGKAIEKMALSQGHTIVYKKDEKIDEGNIEDASVAITFSIPNAAVDNIRFALSHKIPVICGTTGWLDRMDEVIRYCTEMNSAFLYASNFSIGVNLFFNLNKQLAALMNDYDYKISMKEIHHTEKLDAPSGTAITLANDLIENSSYKEWTIDIPKSDDQLYIDVKRKGLIPGTHSVKYQSNHDSIELIHKAKNRKGFVLGALVAAQWIINKEGVFSMEDIFKPQI